MHELDSRYQVTMVKSNLFFDDKFLVEDPPIKSLYSGAWPKHFRAIPVTNFKIGITSAVNQDQSVTDLNNWSENEDPITQMNLLENEDKQVQELIYQIRKSFVNSIRESVAHRLLDLYNSEM